MKYVLVVFTALILCKPSLAQQVGEQAPDFTHSTLSHGTVSLSDFRGKAVFLFFFGHG